MKQLIRKGVFETNSSSAHSITISNNVSIFDTIYPDYAGNITLVGGEWGWEIKYYNDAETKADYCVQDIVTTVYDNKTQKYVSALNVDKMIMLMKVISNHTGCNEIFFDKQRIFDGYIDHQSRGTTDEAFKSIDNLRNFIFNPESILKTDHDNH